MSVIMNNQEQQHKPKMGRPRLFNTIEELEQAIEYYYNSCRTFVYDEKGKQVMDSNGDPAYKYFQPLTMTGLALALGTDRRALLNYTKYDDEQGRDFFPVINRARSRIEHFSETMLYDKGACNGAKFALANNAGWTEKTEINQHTTIEAVFADLSDAQLIERKKQLIARLEPAGLLPESAK
jgi:hypothetical protein